MQTVETRLLATRRDSPVMAACSPGQCLQQLYRQQEELPARWCKIAALLNLRESNHNVLAVNASPDVLRTGNQAGGVQDEHGYGSP